ncbi:protein kinase domain-containing protein [Polyangium jinanense]|uniref:Tetratricopeptide repeat protein n=1 Tax=Polyangium jinanense TaxID=2829994 RepID=A0A9X3XDP7_9BACT|nr:tetratricopeptide repeat protein [Polyangium jinanense]MDC3957743.1 tetratricopeptide repeat protein [Polyangium jinanense]MDC3987535.1 tetratricopeptide repeat protein [Polyangium jinanense]
MSIDIVRGELERLFSLDEMTALSSELLGLDPAQVGGAVSKASFARALTDRCFENDAEGALLDAIFAVRPEADAKLRELAKKGTSADTEIKAGEAFGAFTITRKIGEGPRAVVYAATRKVEGEDKPEERSLKVFRKDAASGPRALQRFLTAVRLAAKVQHEGLPASLEAGVVSGHAYVAYAPIDGQPLAARVTRTGALHMNEAREIVRAVLSALTALHEARVVHGNIKLENVLVGRGEGGKVRAYLVDAGCDRLGAGVGGPFGVPTLARALSPEQIRAGAIDAQSDIYGFGAMLFELLAGKPPFNAETGADIAAAHLVREAPAASSIAPKGWVNKELDEIIARLLDKNPSARPKGVSGALDLVDPTAKSAEEAPKGKTFTDDEINDLADLLLADPMDHDSALALESAARDGADPHKVAEAFVIAASEVDEGESAGEKIKAAETKKQLLFRAARTYENVAKDLEKAEGVLQQIVELDEDDDVAFSALEDVRRQLKKHEEVVEMLLERSEKAQDPPARARALNEIGRLYVRELEDVEQGVFAFAQALSILPQNQDYAKDLERSAGSDMKVWAEALQILSTATTSAEMSTEAKIALFNLLGRWYSEKIARPDMGLPCFQAVLSAEPGHDGALDGMAQLYRRAQQWQELCQILQTRADRAATPERSREIRAEAADVLETRLNDASRARDLFEHIFQEDPSNDKAAEALGRIYHRLEDWAGYAKILERRADALRGEARVEAICKVAELYEDQLNDLGEATRRYEAALDVDPHGLTALRGLDRIYNRTGRYKELVGNLEKQIAISATPRQKINLYERLAGIHDEQFLDHGKAAEAYEAILQIDPAHEGTLTALMRHYRALERWEDVVSLYERLLRIVIDDKRRIELLLAMGRVLVEQVGSPERASKTYEKVIEIDPQHGGALESLANVRAASGDALAALSAIESLAVKATTPETRADLWIRAAKLLDDKGDRDGAIERYKKALDAQPGNVAASTALRASYLARGDATSAVELLGREIEAAEGNLAKARHYGEMAFLLHEKLKDTDRAQAAATKAIDLDPTNMKALYVSGEIAFNASRFVEAAKHFESLANRSDAMPKDLALDVVSHYIDALSKIGSTEKAVSVLPTLLALAPDVPQAIRRAAKVRYDAKQYKESAALYVDLSNRFADKLDPVDRAEAMLYLGQARLSLGEVEEAVLPLLDAADLMPEAPEPIAALVRLYEAKKDWEEVIRLKMRRIDVVSGDERVALLLDVGDIMAAQLGDRTRAAKSYVAALDERPDDRKILTKLMQLYSEEKDWSKLIEVVLKLASKIDDKRQKAKYMHTAAIVSWRQLGDSDKAIEYYDQVLELDPSLDKALAEAIEVREQKGDWEGVERLVRVDLERATERNDTSKVLATMEKLGALYKDKLGAIADAIDAYEAAQTLDPENHEREELLAKLYASDPAQYLDKAVAAQAILLRRNPYRPEPYKLLRKLYTESKRADSAYCLCQALTLMSFAEPDEERFFKRMRSDTAAAAQVPLGEDDWFTNLTHPDADPLLTNVFAVIQPAVIMKNGQPLEALGYQMAYAIDLMRHPYPLSQTIVFAAGVLGLELPICFQNPMDPGGLSFLHAHNPAIVLGAAALATEVPPQMGAFIASRHLTYYRPGMYLRYLVPTGTGLRAWLFAAIKLISPNFPISKDIEGPVKENLAVIEAVITGARRDELASAVTKLLQAGAIDLKKWVAGVDLTADRAGFVVANDLEIAQEIIKAADDSASAVPQKERLKELVLFSVGEDYFAIRRKLGINIDA